MSLRIDLSSEVAMITAGGGRIGSSAATLLARAGAKIAMVDGSAAAAKAIAEQIISEGGTAIAVQADLTDESGLAQALSSVRERLGSVSVLVNSITSDVEEFTGSTGEQPGLSTDPGLTGTINLTRAALADLRVNQGCIVNIISESTRVGGQPMSARVGVNAGVTALTTSLAREVGVEGVRVNLVVAGDLITPERSSFGEQHRALDRLASAHPLGRLGTAADIAGAVLFLASPLAQWITGQVLSVNGGFTNTRAG